MTKLEVKVLFRDQIRRNGVSSIIKLEVKGPLPCRQKLGFIALAQMDTSALDRWCE